MDILLVLPLLFLIFAIGMLRVLIGIAPIATAVWYFHDKIFAGVDVSQASGLHPSALAGLAQTPWGLLAILSWSLLLVGTL
ncbi:TPA: hypothetical protein ACK3Q6_004425, partial [Burkholderia cepacia]